MRRRLSIVRKKKSLTHKEAIFIQIASLLYFVNEQAVAIAAASEANKTAWVKAGTYKISVNGKEFLVELEKEVVRFR